MKNIAIFASGSGSNAENIIQYFQKTQAARVKMILTNNPNAYVLERAQKYQIPTIVFDRSSFYQTRKILDKLTENRIDLVVLAGFLWLVPDYLIQAFPGRIINIHPALLPKYGGKGMYGDKVHQAVLENKEVQSGITIHFVNEVYDEGETILQATCPIVPEDTPKTLAQKIHQLEYQYFPKVIEDLLLKQKN
ncbi:MAG: phosphoribosylglycinamide formyltransferase [Candidatus Cyclobacteriaceae bacterium M3_2C_046]